MPSAELSPGHRKRLREKFLRSGLGGFHDYEIVELLLTLGSPRRDCKGPAKEAIKRFKTLRGVLEAPPQELQAIEGIGPHNVFGIRLVQEAAREFLKERITQKPAYKSSKEVFDYLYHSMRDLRKEVFKVIYLTRRTEIIETIDLFRGTLEGIPIAPREVVEHALRLGASAMIFAHNHPSGDPKPSKTDKQLTRDMVFIGNVMQIKILDHIIIGDNEHFSFAEAGLIEKYKDDFLNLKIKAAFAG